MSKKLLFITLALFSAAVQAVQLKPFKDELFNDEPYLETRDSGRWLRVPYDETRHINGREKITNAAQNIYIAKDERVKRLTPEQVRPVTIPHGGGAMEAYEVGQTRNADFAVIFIHGGGGDRELGVKQEAFGGNFNRLMNLALENNGAYYSPSVTNFGDIGGVSALINQIKKNSPKARIVVACGSAGAETCWKLGESKPMVDQLSGLVFLGGAGVHPNVKSTPAFTQFLPMVFAHGTRDRVAPWTDFDDLYKTLHSEKRPAQMLVYNNGGHGTPIRMIDWRKNLNWIFSQKSPAGGGASDPGGVPGTR